MTTARLLGMALGMAAALGCGDADCCSQEICHEGQCLPLLF